MHFLPQSTPFPRARGEGGLLPGSLPGVSRRAGLQPSSERPVEAEQGRRLHRIVTCRRRAASTSLMPRRPNHRIPRHEGGGNRFVAKPGRNGRDRRSLVIFHRERMDADRRALVERDRGVALCRDGAAGARVALPLLEAALAARSDDVTAWECKGHALARPRPVRRSIGAFRKAVTMEPGRESAVVEAARVAAKIDRRPDAAAYLQRAIAINPWRSDYHAELAFVYFYDRNWQASADACRAGPSPQLVPRQCQEVARSVLSQSGKRRGRARRARDGPWLRSARPSRAAPLIYRAVEVWHQRPVIDANPRSSDGSFDHRRPAATRCGELS